MGTAKNNFITETAIENFNSAISLLYSNQNGSDIKMVPISLQRRRLSPLYKDVIWSLWTCRTWFKFEHVPKKKKKKT